MKTSAPRSAPARGPSYCSALVCSATQRRLSSSPGRPTWTAPWSSHTITSAAPEASRSRSTAVPAAPAPAIVIRTEPSFLPTTRSALVRAARTTIAVPCWSSWKTGMSSSSRSRRSTSKHRGALMSSRLMPPKAGAMIWTVRTISSVSWVSRHSGQASMPGEPLEQRGLALHDRHGRVRADIAQAQHGRAVGDHGHRITLDREAAHILRVTGDGHGDPGHPRRVRHGQVVPVTQRDLDRSLDLPAQVEQEGPVTDLADQDTVDLAQRRDDGLGVVGVAGGAGQVHAQPLVAERDHVQGGDRTAGLLHDVREVADRPSPGWHLEPHGDRIRHARCYRHVHPAFRQVPMQDTIVPPTGP